MAEFEFCRFGRVWMYEYTKLNQPKMRLSRVITHNCYVLLDYSSKTKFWYLRFNTPHLEMCTLACFALISL